MPLTPQQTLKNLEESSICRTYRAYHGGKFMVVFTGISGHLFDYYERRLQLGLNDLEQCIVVESWVKCTHDRAIDILTNFETFNSTPLILSI